MTLSPVTTDTTAPLEDGRSPTTPVGDTIHRRFVVHYADFIATVGRASGGRLLHRDWGVASDLGRPSGLWNSAVLRQPLGHSPTALDEVEQFFADGGSGEALLWSPWPTPDLTARGWHLVGHPPLLVRPPGGTLPARGAGVVIEEVTDPTGVDDAARLVVEGFPFPELQPYRSGALLPHALLDDPRWRLWVARRDGTAVSTGALFVSHGFAQLALAATLPRARRLGAWYGLVRTRLLVAPDLPSGGIFSDDSRPGIERLGYLPVVRFTLWARQRPT